MKKWYYKKLLKIYRSLITRSRLSLYNVRSELLSIGVKDEERELLKYSVYKNATIKVKEVGLKYEKIKLTLRELYELD